MTEEIMTTVTDEMLNTAIEQVNTAPEVVDAVCDTVTDAVTNNDALAQFGLGFVAGLALIGVCKGCKWLWNKKLKPKVEPAWENRKILRRNKPVVVEVPLTDDGPYYDDENEVEEE